MTGIVDKTEKSRLTCDTGTGFSSTRGVFDQPSGQQVGGMIVKNRY